MSKWEKLEKFLECIETEYQVPGGEIMIVKDREMIYSRTFGNRAKEEYAGKDLYWIYSMSKVYTAVSMMQLLEKGLISLEQPVTDFFPELKEIEWKDEEGNPIHIEKAKIRNLLSMTGGLNYDWKNEKLEKVSAGMSGIPDTAEVVKAIFEAGLVYEPGEHFLYSMCHDVCGAIVEKVTGLRLDDYMKKNIFEPLGITNMGFFPTTEEQARILPQYRWNGENNRMDPVSDENQILICEGFPCGGSGLFGNAEDYIKLAEALSNMGLAKNGARILKEESVNKLREDQLTLLGVREDMLERFQNHGMEGFSYALGVRTRIAYTGNSPVGEFGWDGAAGGYVLIDTENHLSMVYLQHVLDMGQVYGEIHPQLRKLLYEALGL